VSEQARHHIDKAKALLDVPNDSFEMKRDPLAVAFNAIDCSFEAMHEILAALEALERGLQDDGK
jgi:hypothetical protein